MFFNEETPTWVRWTITGLTVGVVAIVAGIWALINALTPNNNPPKAQPDKPQSSTSQAAAGETEGSSSSICGLPDGDQTIPTTPPEAEWTQIGGMMHPSSTIFGPGSLSDRTCFTHSPTGAVFYALNVSADPKSENPEGLQFAGFRIVSSSATEVTIDGAFLVTRGDRTGLMFAVPGTARWSDGDWHVDEVNVTPTALANLDGYVAFGPGGQ